MSTPLDRIADYLESPHACPYYLDGSAVDRTVRVRHEQWLSLLDDEDDAGNSSGADDRLRLTGSVRLGVQTALMAIESKSDTIDAETLHDAAVGTRDGDPAALIHAWFLIMCWGAGDRNNYRLRQWTSALTDDRLLRSLAATTSRVEAGDLGDAYREAPLPGVGPSFFTKWLWLISQFGAGPRGYIYDDRIRNTLRVLGWRSGESSPAARWVDYSRTIEQWSTALNDRHGWRTTPDHVEQLLFHRRLSNPSQITLYAHLQQ